MAAPAAATCRDKRRRYRTAGGRGRVLEEEGEEDGAGAMTAARARVWLCTLCCRCRAVAVSGFAFGGRRWFERGVGSRVAAFMSKCGWWGGLQATVHRGI